MRSATIITILILFSEALNAQRLRDPDFTYGDSIKLTKFWKNFKTNLESKNINALRQFSLTTIDCDLFQSENSNLSHDQTNSNTYISFDKFIDQFYHALPKSKLWSVMKTKKYHISLEAIDFSPPNLKLQKGKRLTIYYIWYVTFEPNEIVKGHEGESEGFQFVKVNGTFKFYGLSSVP